MSISSFYQNYSLINDIFYKNSYFNVVNFLSKQLKKNVKTLDVGCGDGQISIEMIELGFMVFGFDISSDMLNILIKNLEKNKSSNFICKDALEFSYKDFGFFSQAYCVRTSFGNFNCNQKNIKYLKNIFNSLQKDGTFILDYQNFHKVIHNFKPVITNQKEDFKLIRKSELINSYMKQTWHLYHEEKLIFSDTLGTYIYFFEEIKNILENIGFKIISVYGDYDSSNFSPLNSDRLIFKLQK